MFSNIIIPVASDSAVIFAPSLAMLTGRELTDITMSCDCSRRPKTVVLALHRTAHAAAAYCLKGDNTQHSGHTGQFVFPN